MLPSEQKRRAAIIILLAYSLPLAASTTSSRFLRIPSRMDHLVRGNEGAPSISISLRHDIASHPGDFITFESEAGANQFILDHQDAYRESERRVVERGIVGYWEGKTLVILPSLLTAAPW